AGALLVEEAERGLYERVRVDVTGRGRRPGAVGGTGTRGHRSDNQRTGRGARDGECAPPPELALGVSGRCHEPTVSAASGPANRRSLVGDRSFVLVCACLQRSVVLGTVRLD